MTDKQRLQKLQRQKRATLVKMGLCLVSIVMKGDETMNADIAMQQCLYTKEEREKITGVCQGMIQQIEEGDKVVIN